MRLRGFALLTALMGLLLASLACSTLLGGAPNDNSDLPRPPATATRSAANENSAGANQNDAVDNDNAAGEANDNRSLGPAGNTNEANENTDNENAGGNLNGNANDNTANDNTTNDNTANDNGEPAAGFDQVPADIPIVNGGNVDDLLAMEGFVSYETDVALDDVIAFYNDEMANLGWDYDASQSVELGDMHMLAFHKSGQLATVVVSASPDSDKTLVLVTVADE